MGRQGTVLVGIERDSSFGKQHYALLLGGNLLHCSIHNDHPIRYYKDGAVFVASGNLAKEVIPNLIYSYELKNGYKFDRDKNEVVEIEKFDKRMIQFVRQSLDIEIRHLKNIGTFERNIQSERNLSWSCSFITPYDH